MHIIPHTCWTMNFCELTLVIKPPTSEEHEAPKKYYYEELDEVLVSSHSQLDGANAKDNNDIISFYLLSVIL